MAYISNPEAFKHYAYGKYKVDFYKQTAIIKWTTEVDSEYNKDYSYKSQKRAILDRLNNSEVFDSKFILLQEISPAEYAHLPVEKEIMELYVNFKRKDLKAKDKKDEIRRFLDNM